MSLPYGFASREEGGCNGTQSCRTTWGNYEACCPQNTVCQNRACCDTNDKKCTDIILAKPKCADDSWTLYDHGGYFCCRPGTVGVGYKVGEADWSACAAHGYESEVNATTLVPIEVMLRGFSYDGSVKSYLTEHVQQHPRRSLLSIPDPPRLLPQLQQ